MPTGLLRNLIVGGLMAIGVLRAQQPTEAELNKLAAYMDKALGLRAGAVVADIGTGLAVQHPLRMAREVGPNGRVVCVEVSQAHADEIKRLIDAEHMGNMGVILGRDDDPRLPQGTFDAMLLSNVYHEFTQPAAMLNHICDALKPEGTLVVVENYSRAHLGDSRAAQALRHDMAPETLERELAMAGFSVKERIDPVLVNSPDRLRYLVRAEKAKESR